MAVTVGVLSDARRRTLEAVCDTFAPSLSGGEGAAQESLLRARRASDLGVPAQIEGLLAQTALPEEIEALGQLLDAFAAAGLRRSCRCGRGRSCCTPSPTPSPEAKLGVRQLRAHDVPVLLRPARRGRAQPELGGDRLPRPAVRAALARAGAEDDRASSVISGETATLSADVCVVGSGAGGGVIAAELARARALGRRARDGPVPQRVRLQAARAAGHVRAVPGRRAGRLGGRLDRDPRRLDAGRRDGRELHELHPHAPARSARSGRRWASRGSTSPTTSGTSTRSGSGSGSTTRRPPRTAPTNG